MEAFLFSPNDQKAHHQTHAPISEIWKDKDVVTASTQLMFTESYQP